MKLNPSYPKGLISEVDNKEITEAALTIIGDHEQTLNSNIEFISTRQSLDELDIEELLKDLYVCFIQESQRGLSFLLEKLKNNLIQTYTEKKIYDFVEFMFVPKELRSLEQKRKALINRTKSACIIEGKKTGDVGSPHLSRSRASERSSPSRQLASTSRFEGIDEREEKNE